MNQDNRGEELIKELRMVANMINMGEKIRWGQETTLMDKAADMLETHHQELQKAREEERERLSITVRSSISGIYPAPDVAPELLGEYERGVIEGASLVKKWVIQALDQSELDQPNK